MRNNRLRLAILPTIALLITSLTGCASSGTGATGGADTTSATAARPDVKNETGANGLLTPAAIVARHVEAIGGEKALRSHSSMTQTGAMEMPAMGMSGDMVLRAAAPNKLAMTIELGGFGSIQQGYNGEVGWSNDPMQGATVLEGTQLTTMEYQADYFGPLNYATRFPTQETLELADWRGESAYKVRLVDADGNEMTQYFSETTSLLIGMEFMQSTPMGEANVTTLLSDYKDFGRGKVASKIGIQMPGFEIEQTISEVEYDTVTDDAFAIPDAVKAKLD